MIGSKSKINVKYFCILALLFILLTSLSNAEKLAGDNWLIQQSSLAFKKITMNTSPFDGLRGAVIASPSRNNPNYYYHWVRDAAIVMDALISYDQHYAKSKEHKKIRQLLFDYLNFTTHIQNLHTLSDLGEPRFYITGSVINGEWGRPQNDSPALRAISLIHWANVLIANGEINIVKEKMYDSELPAKLPIKKDLEYVSHHWQEPSFDLWEEVKGLHFYTLMVSRRALLDGAELARQLNDGGAASWYQSQAKAIEQALQQFYDYGRGFFVATLKRSGGIDYKTSQVDSAVILGLLHGDRQDGFFSWNDPRVKHSMDKIIEVFAKVYPVNQQNDLPAYVIGRYPEDKYNGVDSSEGNPWVLCTLAYAEALYRYANQIEQQGLIEAATTTRKLAAQFVLRVKYHAYPDGSLSEQINRYTGFMTSAFDLTWNYAAIISTRVSMNN